MAKGSRHDRLAEENREAKLLEKFPGGVAEVIAITTATSPMVEGPYRKGIDDRKAMSTTVPIIVDKQLGKTHPVSGMPETQKHVLEMRIWPLPGRTDQFPEGRPWFKKPYALLDYLAKKENGWGTIYRLKPVPAELIEIEKTAGMDPVSAKLFREANNFKSNAELVGMAPRKTANMTEDELLATADVDDEEIAEDEEFTDEIDAASEAALLEEVG